MVKIRRLVRHSFFILLFSACGQAPASVVMTSQVTQLTTVEVTRLTTVEVTRIVVVTATFSGPTETYTPTTTLAPTATPRPTIDQTKADKIDGSYMVGTEIAAGIWRSGGGLPNEKCWIQIKTLSGDLVDIAGDLPGGTIRIPAGNNIVYIGGGSGNKCTWTFLKP